MPACKPEECDILLMEALQRKDLETVVALYEPNATFILDSGEAVTGKAAIREALKTWIAFDEVSFTTEIEAFQSADGNLAMTRGTWSATTKGADGNPVTLTGKNAEVVRRQPDGTWLFAIDNPRGAD